MTDGTRLALGGIGRGFRRYWLGHSVSFVGSQLTDFLLPVIAATVLHASPLWLGALVAADQLPHLLAPFYAGPLADRYPRWRIMIATDVARFGVVGAIPVVAWLGWLSSPLLCLFVFALAALSVTFEMASFSYVPDIVPPQRLTAANGAIHGSFSFAQVAGPGLGALLLAIATAPVALLADAVSYLASAVMIVASGARTMPVRPAPPVSWRGLISDAMAGLRVVWQTPSLRTLNLSSGLMNFWVSGALSVFAIYVLRVLGLSASQYGVAAAIGAVAGIVGAATSARMAARVGAARLLPILLMLTSLDTAIPMVAMVSPMPVRPVVIIVAMLIGSGVAAMYMVVAATTRQLATGPEMRGRVAASMRFFTRGAMPVGAMLGGAVAMATSPVTVLGLCSVGQLLTGWWCWRHRHDLVDAPEPSPAVVVGDAV